MSKSNLRNAIDDACKTIGGTIFGMFLVSGSYITLTFAALAVGIYTVRILTRFPKDKENRYITAIVISVMLMLSSIRDLFQSEEIHRIVDIIILIASGIGLVTAIYRLVNYVPEPRNPEHDLKFKIPG